MIAGPLLGVERQKQHKSQAIDYCKHLRQRSGNARQPPEIGQLAPDQGQAR